MDLRCKNESLSAILAHAVYKYLRLPRLSFLISSSELGKNANLMMDDNATPVIEGMISLQDERERRVEMNDERINAFLNAEKMSSG